MTTNDFQSVYAFQITLTSHGQSMTTYFDKKGRVQKVEAGIWIPLTLITPSRWLASSIIPFSNRMPQPSRLRSSASKLCNTTSARFASTVTGLLTAKPHWQAQASKLERRSVSPWERCPQVPKFMRLNAR